MMITKMIRVFHQIINNDKKKIGRGIHIQSTMLIMNLTMAKKLTQKSHIETQIGN